MPSLASMRLVDVAHDVLHRCDRVAHIQRFLAAGLTREQVGHLVHLGALTRPRIGWYADPSLPASGVAAIRVGGALGCVSAAAFWGLPVPERSGRLVHVSLQPGTTRLRRSNDATARARANTDPHSRWHWEARVETATGWRVGALDAILQMSACVEYRWLVAAIDAARCGTHREPLLDDRGSARLRELLPEHLKRAVDDSDPLAESSGETFIRLGLREAQIPVRAQAWLTEIYRSDLLVDEWLPIESDGAEFHSGIEAMERDRQRDATLASLGVPPLRFSQRQATHETVFVVDTIRAVWSRGRPPGLRDPQFLRDTRR